MDREALGEREDFLERWVRLGHVVQMETKDVLEH